MTIRYLAAGLALAALLSACGQKQSSTESTPAATAQSESSAPATSAPRASSPAPAAEALAGAKPFSSKTGRIEFALSGMRSGTETMTWDNYGLRQVTDSKTTLSIGNLPPRTHETRVIRDDDSITILNFENKTAMKMDHLMEQAKAMTGGQDMRAYSQEIMAEMGGSKTGTDSVLGKSCDVWTMTKMGTTLCIWKGLALKTETEMMGVKVSKLATKIDENVAIDASLFEVPAGFTVTAAPAMPANGMPGVPGGMQGGMGSPMMGGTNGPGAPAPSDGD